MSSRSSSSVPTMIVAAMVILVDGVTASLFVSRPKAAWVEAGAS